MKVIPFLNAYQVAHLEKHVKEKAENLPWLAKCLEGHAISFPYQPKESGKANIDPCFIIPKNCPQTLPTVGLTATPLYLINIPMGWPIDSDKTDALEKLLKLIRDEAFGTETIAQDVVPRIAVVIGHNQIQSLDPEHNQKFRNLIETLPVVAGIAYQTAGFLWKPEWRKVAVSELTYTIEKSYFILKMLSKERAATTLHELETTKNSAIASQIPFQRIRQKLLHCNASMSLLKKFEEKSCNSPIYYCVMDADMSRLRDGLGYFSKLDEVIHRHAIPSAVSLGYSFSFNENPIVAVGCIIDMRVRQAMCQAVPYGAYFPEPGSVFCIRKPNQPSVLQKLSFLGDGNNLENKRLIQNGRINGIFDDRAIFIGCGGVTTAIPSRALTLKNKITTLSLAQVKQKQYLQALRNVTQSHAFPKQWAENLYAALSFSCSQVTDATEQMMHIFSVYDPISRMFANIGKFSSSVFDEIIRDYHNPLTDAQSAILSEAKQALAKLKMSKSEIDKVVLAATYSGEAIHSIFVQLNTTTGT